MFMLLSLNTIVETWLMLMTLLYLNICGYILDEMCTGHWGATGDQVYWPQILRVALQYD